MSKKHKLSELFSRNFLLNNLKEKNIDGETHRIFKFIIHKDKIKEFIEQVK